MYPRPRNTLVLCKLIPQSERKMGAISVPTAQDCYCEAEVMEVGPGVSVAAGGRPSTFDLNPGQVVMVQYRRMANPTLKQYVDMGCPVVWQGEKYHLYEESYIGAILFDTRAEYEASLPSPIIH